MIRNRPYVWPTRAQRELDWQAAELIEALRDTWRVTLSLRPARRAAGGWRCAARRADDLAELHYDSGDTAAEAVVKAALRYVGRVPRAEAWHGL